ncbi:MAG TPA: hypothetical protein PLF85_13350 [Turneriella sp.]|nr:hypothetical protein [Turneriella sp.]
MVQTMALEQAFKLAGGQRGKKGYYQEYSGERALWKGYGGDLISEGSGEQGGWVNGQKWNKLAWRGLQEEESKLAKARADWQTAAAVTNGAIVAATGVIASIMTGGAAAPAVIGLLAAAQTTTIQVGSSFSSNRADQAWGQLQMGILQMGISGLGAFLGRIDYLADAGKLTKVANAMTKVMAQNAVSYAGSGFQMSEDGSIAYKAPSKGALYSTLVSTGFGAAGAGINAGVGWGSLTSGVVSTTANAIGAGFQFNDDGSSKAYDWKKTGTSFASNLASVTASYYATGALNRAGINDEVNEVLSNQIGRAANVVTGSLLGDENAVNAYRVQGLFNTIGTNIGDILGHRANGGKGTGEPLRELLAGSAILTARREQELADQSTDPKSGAKKISDPMADLFGAIGSGIASGASSVWSGIKSGASAVASFFSNAASSVASFATNTFERFGNLVSGAGFNTNSQVEAIRNETNSNVADTMQLTPGYAAVANRLGGKLTNVDGNPAVIKPDGTFEFINDKDAIAAEADMLGMSAAQTRGGRVNLLGYDGFDLSEEDAFAMESALARDALASTNRQKKAGINNFVKKSQSTKIDGITIKFKGELDGSTKLKAGQAALWKNLVEAAKAAGVTEITVGSVERSAGTHVDGYSADVLNVTFAGESKPTAYNRETQGAQRAKLEVFEQAFIKLADSEAAWTPNQMLSNSTGKAASKQGYDADFYKGSNGQMGSNFVDEYPSIAARAQQIKNTNASDAYKILAQVKKEFGKTIKDESVLKAITGSIQHVDHGHFMVRRPIYRPI